MGTERDPPTLALCDPSARPEASWRPSQQPQRRRSIVTALVNVKIASADDSLEDSVSDRTAVVIDAECQRRLAKDEAEPRPSTENLLGQRQRGIAVRMVTSKD